MAQRGQNYAGQAMREAVRRARGGAGVPVTQRTSVNPGGMAGLWPSTPPTLIDPTTGLLYFTIGISDIGGVDVIR